MSETVFDLVIIGAGPGGYTGAIRAAQLGLKVAIVEKDKTLGGTCLNVGCIPSKALLNSSEHYESAKHNLESHGVETSDIKLNLDTMMSRKRSVVKELTDGIDYLMSKNKIEKFMGLGRLKSNNEVEVVLNGGGTQILQTKNIMLATGSVPNELPFLPFDEETVVSSTGALSLTKVPDHLIIIGGGVIGLELGSVWNRLGSKVTVLEFSDAICGGMDKRMSKRFLQLLKKQGLEFALNAKAKSADVNKKGVSITYEDMKKKQDVTVNGDVVLVATGRRPYSAGVGLDNVGVKTNDRGQVEIDDHFRTSVANIYAVGDLVRGPMLAHKAEEEGVAVAEIISGQHGHVNYHTCPGIIYTWPEFASVGYTEEQLKEMGTAFNSGTFPFSANGRAKAMMATDGQVKILADKESDKILGVHIVGPNASDLIAEATIAMEFGASAEDVARSFHAHPTLSEVIREAALAVDGRARQM